MMNGTEKQFSVGAPLRIAVIAHALRVAGGVSVGKGLISAMARVAPQHSYYITVPEGLGYEEICRGFPHCRTLVYQHWGGFVRRFWDERFSIPAKVRAFQPDIVWALGNLGIPRPGCPQALLIVNPHHVYDVRHFGPISRWSRFIYQLKDHYLRQCLPEVDMVFCQTETMRRRFIDCYGYRRRVEICSTAGALREVCPSRTIRPGIFTKLEGKFVLFCLSKYYPHKNLEGIVDTFALYRKELYDCVVLLSPEKGQKTRKLLSRVKREGLEESIIDVGHIPHQDLAGYYQYSQGMIIPTFIESFSSTYVEAMQFSCPILTSDLDFAHEVCGEAAFYFDPRDPRSIRDAILRLKNDPVLSGRLVERGKARLEQFPRSWDEIIRTTMEQLLDLSRIHYQG